MYCLIRFSYTCTHSAAVNFSVSQHMLSNYNTQWSTVWQTYLNCETITVRFWDDRLYNRQNCEGRVVWQHVNELHLPYVPAHVKVQQSHQWLHTSVCSHLQSNQIPVTCADSASLYECFFLNCEHKPTSIYAVLLKHQRHNLFNFQKPQSTQQCKPPQRQEIPASRIKCFHTSHFLTTDSGYTVCTMYVCTRRKFLAKFWYC